MCPDDITKPFGGEPFTGLPKARVEPDFNQRQMSMMSFQMHQANMDAGFTSAESLTLLGYMMGAVIFNAMNKEGDDS
jgi:hypothetical protein